MAMDGDWLRVAEYVRDRRDELEMTQADVHAAGGPSTATQRLIEGGLSTSYQPSVLAKLERVLGWQRGSVRVILKGGEPTLLGDRNRPPLRAVPDGKGGEFRLTDDEEALWELFRQFLISRSQGREGGSSAG